MVELVTTGHVQSVMRGIVGGSTHCFVIQQKGSDLVHFLVSSPKLQRKIQRQQYNGAQFHLCTELKHYINIQHKRVFRETMSLL